MANMAKKLIIIICTLLLAAEAGLCAKRSSGPQVRSETAQIKKPVGPTVFLDLDSDIPAENSICTFMYFVPMISPVLVESETSTANNQKAKIISYTRKTNSKSFEVLCEFEMRGKGSHKNTFEPAEIIAKNTKNLKDGAPLKNMLDYIKFEGQGFGTIRVKGKIIDELESVEKVEITFNSASQKSPVTIGLYSVKPNSNKYEYRNRYNKIVARVNKLTFSNGSEHPRMGIQIASLNNKGKREGLCSRIKGKIANLFIKPIGINKAGNTAMLEFGYALYKRQASFTFPKAKNLKAKAKAGKKDIGIVASVMLSKKNTSAQLD